ncbi:RNA polymerase II-associated protein 1 [Macleaya cordata]|uniref:RNA polymerase II-associated protein 1 n=1 Tax=Macleaya cordata TaxID=56857 RepID=A0A200QJZ1_MACCD|nr:RNA polymerase II-associated protein 1 [Macleaya cordata]
MEEEDSSSRLVGGIVEKGFSSSTQTLKKNNGPTSFPRPTVLPFPVARHRSHGPHWAPIGSELMDVDDDNEDKGEDDTEFNPVSPKFACPIQRKEKKGLDFKNWRELLSRSSVANEIEIDKSGVTQSVKGKREREEEESDKLDRRDICKEPFLPNVDTTSPTEVKREASMSDGTNSGETVTTDSSAARVFETSVMNVEQVKLDSFPNNLEREQSGIMPLKVQIDAENRARLQQMSPGEIAEARAEIMEKMNPGLLEKLKKRGQNKLGKGKEDLKSNMDTGCQPGSLHDENLFNKDSKSDDNPLSEEAKTSYVSPVMPAKDAQSVPDSGGLNTSGTPNNNNLWNAWSKRVEAARMLRFSLDGNVLGTHSVLTKSQHNANNITERDFLRTEGDPGALGYTIKEAVALSRSMVPGQRALALQLLASVFDKALCNLQQSAVGYDMRNASKIDKPVDWQAVWAFALGPEPELALALRMALDDNHVSVVLASVKVIHCVLSCDVNEHFFDISEKLATYQKEIYTSPVFRSRPKIEDGFLHGGFWKYNTKPSSILPLGDETVDAQNEGEHTIQDDIVVAGQDIAAGLVRMGILPRICYLLETDPAAGLEEYLISILIGLARHSPTCADAIIKCPRLVQTIVVRFTDKDSLSINPSPSKIKSVTLLKVLAQSDKKNCMHFIEKGIFRDMMWHLYKYPVPHDHWIKSGREYCKLMSALMIEQLRLWRVCIKYGYCICYFTDFFPSLCMWLSPPTFDKLIEKHVLGDFASITREAYILLEALARRLPNLHSEEQLKMQTLESADYNMETWSWSHVSPMVELALKWLSLESSPYLSKILGCHKGASSNFFVQDSYMSSLLWVISSVMHMLTSILVKVVPEGANSLHESGGHVPWLPEFVPKIGLVIVKNRYLSFSGTNDMILSEGGSLVKDLCGLRLHSDIELSLSSVCCLHRLVQLIVSLDKSIQLAKRGNCNPSSQGYSFSSEGKILENGIVMWSQDQLRSVLVTIMRLLSSGWQNVHAIETFGRGGPAPGIGLGWGASGGGFWSVVVLLEQTEARLLMGLLDIFQIDSEKYVPTVEDMTFTAQRMNAVLGASLTSGPRDTVVMEKTFDLLLQAPVLKYLNLFIRHFLHLKRGIKPFRCEYNEEDHLRFSKVLNTHFRNRWLCVKSKTKAVNSNTDLSHNTIKKGSNALDTIYEDIDKSDVIASDSHCTSLVIEWAHQRLPLPTHWFLSPISTISGDRAALDLPNTSSVQNHMSSPTDEALEVAKSGLFFLLGLEAMSTFPCTDMQSSPVCHVPLVWKLHSLSVVLLVGMSVLQDEKSRDTYEILQDLYGQLLDESRCSRSIKSCSENLLPETRNKDGVELLQFQSEIHESYSTFIETLVEQFGAISYGDLIYGRQVAVYLHRSVEVPVRIAAWNALSNAHILELLPPLEKCFAEAEGYLETEDNEGILEAYLKSWISGNLDKAAVRGSITFTLALHHLSSFIFHNNADDKLSLRNKLARSLLRDSSRKQQHEAMMLDLIRYTKSGTSQEHKPKLETCEMEKRFEVLTGACEGNSSLLSQVDKLKSKK